MKRKIWKPVVLVFVLGMIVAHGAIFWNLHRAIFAGYGDFAAFYTAGKLVQHHQGSELYNRSAQWRVQQEFAADVGNRQGPLAYVHPPFEALFFALLAYLKYPMAWVVWTGLKLCVLFAIPFLLNLCSASFPAISPAKQALFSLATFPAAIDLLQGQDEIFLLLFFSLALIYLIKGGKFQAGLCLALALIKFQLVIPIVLIFLLRRQWRVVAGFASGAAVLLLISVALMGWNVLSSYPRYLLDIDQSSSLGVSIPSEMPNLRGLTAPLADRIHGARSSPWYLGSYILFTLAGVAIAAHYWPTGEPDLRRDLAGFSMALAITVVTAYYSYGYDLILLFIPLALEPTLFSGISPASWPRKAFLVATVLLLFTPLLWLLMNLRQFGWMALVVLLFSVSLAGVIGVSKLTGPPLTPELQKSY